MRFSFPLNRHVGQALAAQFFVARQQREQLPLGEKEVFATSAMRGRDGAEALRVLAALSKDHSVKIKG
jgi:hypothetical protein